MTDKMYLIKIMLVAIPHIACMVRISEACQEPVNADRLIASALYDLYTDPLYSNFSLNVVPCFLNRFPSAALTTETLAIPNTCDQTQGSQICAAGTLQGLFPVNNGQFYGRAKCEWEYALDSLENRIPRTIAKARCKCLHCHRGTCSHIYSFIPVVFKECNEISGVYTYRKSVQKVPVGCACVTSRAVAEPDISSEMPVMSA